MASLDSLAIVIPAYKGNYFSKCLESIAEQSDQTFTVYVGDDASPDPIKDICQQYSDRMRLKYHRFEKNLGQSSLVRQWHRCIELTAGEEWVWLFPDDDVMERGCVSAFYSSLRSNSDKKNLLYRFNTNFIDENGVVTNENPCLNSDMTSEEFLVAKLNLTLNSSLAEYIFSRRSYEDNGGFPIFDLGWCADDAAWSVFSRGGSIKTLGPCKVGVRLSGSNISSDARFGRRKLYAVHEYLRWLYEQESINIDRETFNRLTRKWAFNQFSIMRAHVGVLECVNFAHNFNALWRDGFVRNLVRMFNFKTGYKLDLILRYVSGNWHV